MDLSYEYEAQAGELGVGTAAGNAGQLMGISANSRIGMGSSLEITASQNYSYDTLGRLVTASGPGGGSDQDATPGLYDPVTGNFFLKNTNAGGTADETFSFGVGGSQIQPLVGDWNGDGIDTVGLYNVLHTQKQQLIRRSRCGVSVWGRRSEHSAGNRRLEWGWSRYDRTL
jgi:hypothetical protein